MFFDWHPTVVHDLHESVALLITWNGTGPTNENVDPVAYDERAGDELSRGDDPDRLRHAGVWTWNFGDDFAHLFSIPSALNHNALGRGYETFGNGTAETLVQTLAAGRDQPGLVPALAAAERAVSLVGARQCQLQGDGGSRRARLLPRSNRRPCCSNFYRTRLRTRWRKGRRGGAVRVPDPGRSGRSDARRAVGIALARAGHRSQPRDRRHARCKRRSLSGGHLRGAARPAVSQLCRRPV